MTSIALVAAWGGSAFLAGCGGDDTSNAGADPSNSGGSTGSGGDSTGGGPTASGGGTGTGGATGTTGSGGGAPTGGGQGYGDVHMGEYDQGWVEWQGSFPNSCEPYTPDLEAIEGNLLVRVSTELFGGGELCDACIRIDTAMGKSVVARVITNGTTQAPGNVDVSHAVWDAISSGEYPRTMTWRLAKCPDTGKIYYQFQTGAHADWSSLWVRNPRVAVKKVEVKSARHADWAALQLGTDGTYTDGGGFGAGSFTLQITAMDDQVVTDTFPGFMGGDVLESSGNFQ